MNYRIYPPEDILQATVTMPLSKSVSNRALIISALTDSPAPLAPVADCSDTRAMQHALASADEHIDIGDAGTAMRFLTAYYATREGRITLSDGSSFTAPCAAAAPTSNMPAKKGSRRCASPAAISPAAT